MIQWETMRGRSEKWDLVEKAKVWGILIYEVLIDFKAAFKVLYQYINLKSKSHILIPVP